MYMELVKQMCMRMCTVSEAPTVVFSVSYKLTR